MAAVIAVAVAVGTAGTANADNSNSNTNNNDVTQQGGPGGGSDSGGSEKTSWPPTDLGWPPNEVMSGGVDSGNKKGNENESSSSTPIVTPGGPATPAVAAGTSTEETPKPIVPANAS